MHGTAHSHANTEISLYFDNIHGKILFWYKSFAYIIFYFICILITEYSIIF